MNDFVGALISVLVFIAMGYMARRFKLLDENITRTIYRFLFTIPLPVVVLVSLANARAEVRSLALPLIGAGRSDARCGQSLYRQALEV